MVFVLLLIVTLSVLIQVETSMAGNQLSSEKAEQNALLALRTAIGELQKHAGVDQRVTARSDIMDDIPETLALDGHAHGRWTGVWDSTSGDVVTWLVSGNEALSATDPDFVDIDFTGELVTLKVPTEVEVPLSSLGDSDAYAYLVSDEGVKAKITLPKDESLAQPLISAQQIDVTQMTDLEWLSSVEPEARRNVLNSEQLKGAADSPGEEAAIEGHYEDLTTYSYGLLTNVADGGLKKDLTLALYENSQMPTGQIFGPLSGTASDADKGGPLWSQLQSWVSTPINASGELPVRPQTDTETGFYPVVTLFQIYFLPRYASDGSVHMEFLPAVVLWNPYDRVLETTDYRLDYGLANNNNSNPSQSNYFRRHFGHWDIGLTGQGYQDLEASQSAEIGFTLPGVRLEPGEAMCFSPPAGNVPLDVPDSNFSLSAGQNQLLPGFRPTASYSIDTGHSITPPTSTTTEPQKFALRPHWDFERAFRLVRLSDSATLCASFYGMGNIPSTAPTVTMQAMGGPVTDLSGSVGVRFIRNFVEYNTDQSVKWLAHYNPRAAAQGLNPMLIHDKAYNEAKFSRIHNPSIESYLTTNGDEHQVGFPVAGDSGGAGFSINPVYTDKCILFESPPERTDLHSIGQLMHAPLYSPRLVGNTGKQRTHYGLRWGRFDSFLPAYPIGSSVADPMIPVDQLFVDWEEDYPSQGSVKTYCETRGQHYDFSYLLNEALWDDYFFSTIPSDSSRQAANQRFVALDATDTSTMSSSQVAANFMVDGAFNINSTSEEAWRSILSAFYGEQVAGNQETGSPFLRIHDNPGLAFDSGSSDEYSSETYAGYRTLTADQIVNLAHQIVKEVKRRGPFVSMAGFVNRDPYTDAPSGLGVDAFRLKGALTAVIEAADNITAEEADALGITVESARINAALANANVATVPRTEPGYIDETQDGWRTEMLPGWFSQADLLARLGAVLTNRSDTFTIYVYGEHTNPFNGEVSKAYGEAVVQRMPEFVDSSEVPETAIVDLNSTLNQDFGRRYVVVSFRWLNQG